MSGLSSRHFTKIKLLCLFVYICVYIKYTYCICVYCIYVYLYFQNVLYTDCGLHATLPGLCKNIWCFVCLFFSIYLNIVFV